MNSDIKLNSSTIKKIVFGELFVLLVIIALISKMNNQTYIITFDSNGGSEIVTQKVKKGRKVIEPKNPTKESATFMYWALDDKQYDFNQTVNSDLTLKAIWNDITPNTTEYTVVFDSNGGTAIESQKVKNGEKAVKPTSPTRDGYTFDNWYLDSDIFDFDTIIEKNITLKAHWQKEQKSNTANNNNIQNTNASNNNSSNSGNPWYIKTESIPITYYSSLSKTDDTIFKTFQLNVTQNYDNNTTYFNDKFPIPDTNPVHDGYEFIGWAFRNYLKIDSGYATTVTHGEYIQPKFRYVAKTPQLSATYLRTGSTSKGNVVEYRITNNNYVKYSTMGSRNWVLFAARYPKAPDAERSYIQTIVEPITPGLVVVDGDYYEVMEVNNSYIDVSILSGYGVSFKAIEHSFKKDTDKIDYTGTTIDTSSEKAHGELISNWSEELVIQPR